MLSRSLLVSFLATAVLGPGAALAEGPANPPSSVDGRVEQAAIDALGKEVESGRATAAIVVFVRDGAVRFSMAWGFEDPARRVPDGTASPSHEVACLLA